jgi:hypothetical protein
LRDERSTEGHEINYACSRFSVGCRYRGKEFSTFQADVSICPDFMEVERTDSFDLIGRFPRFPIRQPPRAFQFAEKAHAYSLPLLPYAMDPYWKAKHLADLLLLIENNIPLIDDMAEQVPSVFTYRGTHEVPVNLPHAQTYRNIPEAFNELTERMSLSTKDSSLAYSKVARTWSYVVEKILRNEKARRSDQK